MSETPRKYRKSVKDFRGLNEVPTKEINEHIGESKPHTRAAALTIVNAHCKCGLSMKLIGPHDEVAAMFRAHQLAHSERHKGHGLCIALDCKRARSARRAAGRDRDDRDRTEIVKAMLLARRDPDISDGEQASTQETAEEDVEDGE